MGRRWLLLIPLAFLMIFAMARTVLPMADVQPSIVALQFATTPERAREIFAVWAQADFPFIPREGPWHAHVLESIMRDFWGIAAYATFFTTACWMTAACYARGTERDARFLRWGILATACQPAAAIADIIENLSHIQILRAVASGADFTPVWLWVGAFGAGLKFALLAFGGVFLIAAAFRRRAAPLA